MIIPYSWVPKHKYDNHFTARVTSALHDSRRSAPMVMGLFEKQTTQKRRESALKAAGSRMGKAFAAKLFRKES